MTPAHSRARAHTARPETRPRRWHRACFTRGMSTNPKSSSGTTNRKPSGLPRAVTPGTPRTSAQADRRATDSGTIEIEDIDVLAVEDLEETTERVFRSPDAPSA